jgi:peptidoglycan/xylan/chitin deacetylase (PgdA/CDA1 family)
MPVIRGAGLRFTAASQVNAYAANLARYDSLMTANAGYVDIVHHSLTHVSTGSLTGAGLNAEIEKADHYDSPPWHAGVDTSAITGFAYPGDAAKPKYSFEALSKIISYGYTSARCLTQEASSSSLGVINLPAWTRPMNMHTIAVTLCDSFMIVPGSSPPTPLSTAALVKEALFDVVDYLYYNEKAAAVVYIHNQAIDGITPAVLQLLIDRVNASNCARMTNYYDMLAMRMSGSPFVGPATITNATAAAGFYNTLYAQLTASPAGFLGAAKYDSVRTAAGTPQVMKDNMLKVWVDRKGN